MQSEADPNSRYDLPWVNSGMMVTVVFICVRQ